MRVVFMTRELSLLAGIFKNLVVEKSSATGSNDSTALKLPVKFIAIIKKINQELALLTWKGKSFYVQIDTPVKENELLLLQLKKESQGKQFYQVIARSPAEGENSCTTSWYVFPPQRENTPPLPFLKFKLVPSATPSVNQHTQDYHHNHRILTLASHLVLNHQKRQTHPLQNQALLAHNHI